MDNPYKNHDPVHPKCRENKGCEKIVFFKETPYCVAYIKPSVFWKRGGCPLASHIVRESNVDSKKLRVGQQKQKSHKK